MKIDRHFPEIDIFGRIKKHSNEVSSKLRAKKFFNGNKVKEWTGISEGKMVGELMKGYKKHCKEVIGMSLDDVVNGCKNEDEMCDLFMMYYQFGRN